MRARTEFLLHWLAAREPDVVGLQELKATEAEFPFAELEKMGYRAVLHGQKAWNGVAILSREPARVLQRGLPGQEELGARLITAEVGDLCFTTVYCPNGKSVEHDDFPRKLAWFDALLDHLDAEHDPAKATVLCGDFNLCPAALDSWNEPRLNGRIFHTPEERQRFQRLLDWGFIDLYRHRHPETRTFSWWDYRSGAFHRNMGLRIDFLLATPSVAGKLQSVETDRDYRKKKDGMTASDHAPVIAEF